MHNFLTIEFEKQADIGIIWLNRPDIHNAFNEVMIQEIIDCVEAVNEMNDIRVLIIRGRGRSFCAGADLNWMRGVAEYSHCNTCYMLLDLNSSIHQCERTCTYCSHGR